MVLRISLTELINYSKTLPSVWGPFSTGLPSVNQQRALMKKSELATTLPQYGLLGWPEEGEDNTVHLYDASAMLDYEQTEVVHPRVGKLGLIRQVNHLLLASIVI